MAIATKSNYGITESLIRQIVDRIVREFHPYSVILYGSYARDDHQSDSDLDLFVVMESDLRRDLRSVAICKLFGDRHFPLDVIAYTPSEAEVSLARGNPFIREIMEEGRVLYAR